MDKTRSNNGFGINPITNEEITAWSEGMKKNIIPFEREAIRAVDDAYMTYIKSKANKDNK